MATADQLLELIFSWIEKRERCAEQLRKQAGELESLREKCNGSECIGSSVSVVGAACLIGAGVATLCTGGAAAPFLGVLGATYTGVGVTISVATKLTEHFKSSSTMKEAQNIQKNSDDIGEKIQRLFQKLKAEKKEVSSFADPDELDRHIMSEILRAMARRSGLKRKINISAFEDDDPRFFFDDGPAYMNLNRGFLKPELMIALTGILAFFTFEVSGKKFKLLFAKGAEQLIKKVSSTGFKTFLKGGGMVVGGAVGMAFALPEAIDNWKDMIKNNHVTEASKSLRDTADAILKITRTLREQFDDIKRMFDEMAKSQQEHEEKLSRENTTQQECKEKAETLKMVNNTSSNQAKENHRNQNEQTGSGDQGGGDPGDEESDDEEETEEDEGSDSEEETEEDEGSDSEEETEEDEGSDSEEETEEKNKRIKKSGQVSCVDQNQKSNRSINEESKTNQRPPEINIGLLNVCSLNKTKNERIIKEEVKDIITRENLDVFLTTETSLKKKGGDQVLKDASPENFSFFHKPREVRSTFKHGKRKSRGGGVGIQYSQVLRGKRKTNKQTKKPETFEYVSAELQHDEWGQPVLFINVYRPPGNLKNMTKFRLFLDEFERLLDELSGNYNSIIVTGDFNIWVDDNEMPSTIAFKELLEKNNLLQHVEGPTQWKGHTLDLVITRNVEISGLTVQDDDISDHYTVIVSARPVTTDPKQKAKENKDEEEKTKREE